MLASNGQSVFIKIIVVTLKYIIEQMFLNTITIDRYIDR